MDLDATKAPEPASPDAAAGAGSRFTAAEAAERAGLEVDRARRLWRTLGFPEHGERRAYDQADVAALGVITEVLGEGVLDFDIALNLARGVGLTMARLADWEVGELLQLADEAIGEAVSDGDPSAWLADQYGERFEKLLLYVWRRHLDAAITRIQASRAEHAEVGTTDLTVGFADIVGFTALSNEVTRQRIGELVDIFETRCGDVISREQGRMIKSMGDAVLFVNDDPLAAIRTAEGIINVIGRDPRMPDVRVGLATGGVVLRLGDVFGPPVNLAARLTQVARRNRIIVDHATADRLDPDVIEARPLPPRPVRGFGVVEPVAVRRA